MKEDCIVQAAISLLDCFLQEQKPIDVMLAYFFKNNRFIGAQDRREISKLIYDILRNYELLSYLNSKITNNYSRFLVITFLKKIRNYSDKKMNEVFSGFKFAPEKLIDFEKKFIQKLPEVNLAELPENIRLNYPEWMATRLHERFTQNFAEEMQAFNHKAPVDIRVNTLNGNSKNVLQKLKADGIAAEKMHYAKNGIRLLHGNLPASYELLKEGIIEIQDEGSQLIAEICGVKPNDTVVDFCAGAGGKTLALAAIMENTGRIYAADKEEFRLDRAKQRLRRAGACNVYCNQITNKWIKRHIGFADCVLVDAPCSGSGTWRRNPDSKIRITENDIIELSKVQAEILESASRLVKIGGTLVYATCSLFLDENEKQIADFIKNHSEYKIENARLWTPQNESQNNESLFFSSSPYEYGTDGFFCAKLRKIG